MTAQLCQPPLLTPSHFHICGFALPALNGPSPPQWSTLNLPLFLGSGHNWSERPLVLALPTVHIPPLGWCICHQQSPAGTQVTFRHITLTLGTDTLIKAPWPAITVTQVPRAPCVYHSWAQWALRKLVKLFFTLLLCFLWLWQHWHLPNTTWHFLNNVFITSLRISYNVFWFMVTCPNFFHILTHPTSCSLLTPCC